MQKMLLLAALVFSTITVHLYAEGDNQTSQGEAIVGYALKKDFLVRDTTPVNFTVLKNRATYPFLGKVEEGYLVLLDTDGGMKRIALVPYEVNGMRIDGEEQYVT